jgi:hypothetical protein
VLSKAFFLKGCLSTSIGLSAEPPPITAVVGAFVAGAVFVAGVFVAGVVMAGVAVAGVVVAGVVVAGMAVAGAGGMGGLVPGVAVVGGIVEGGAGVAAVSRRDGIALESIASRKMRVMAAADGWLEAFDFRWLCWILGGSTASAVRCDGYPSDHDP